MKPKKSNSPRDITHVYMGRIEYQDDSDELETSRPYLICDSRENITANQRTHDVFGLMLGQFQIDYRGAKIVAVYIEDVVAKGTTVLTISGDNISDKPRTRQRPEPKPKPRERARVIPLHAVQKN